MAHTPRARSDDKPPGRADGLTIAPAPGGRKTLLLLAGAGAVAAITLLSLFGPRQPEAPLSPPADSQSAVRPAAPALPPRIEVRAVRAPAEEPPTPPSDTPDAEAPLPAREAMPIAPIAPSGIGLFPPPGTDPPKIGIIVPEGFELPEGYVRHYQVTDDGQALPPILMFHPDYDWVDEGGAHVEASENGVVPPELAPAGMPIEMLELPETPSEP
ncbi:MAG TPA: hypothetical protein VNF72_01770 [Myxococcota bacterium]|jgi:hypothetical protein|nr:hypothetical protein [Myxococcota bacterium]